MRTGPRDHDAVVLNLHHPEMQCGAQVGEAFYSKVIRLVGGKDRAPCLFGLERLVNLVLALTVRNRRINRNIDVILDQVGIFHASLQRLPRER